MKSKVLWLVVPCYNEELVLPDTSAKLRQKMESLIQAEQISADSKILFVDDGSQDATWSLIEKYHQENPLFTGVKLSRNRGHQNALLAGLTTASQFADLTISLDADLQDDIDAIDKMLIEHDNGAEIVYGVRSKRKKDRFLKRFTAQAFYKMLKRMGVETIYNHADYRLMGKQALATLLEYTETNLYLRGLIPQLGFKTAKVEYERNKRQAGKSKYSLGKMMNLALDGVTSFSIKPLIMIFWLGIFFAFIGTTAFVTTLVLKYVLGLSLLWTVMSAGLLLTGVVLIALGVIGVYLGKMYLEIKRRPRFIIEKTLTEKNK